MDSEERSLLLGSASAVSGDDRPLCKLGCGRRILTRGYDTCCRTCARTLGQRHGPFCEGVWVENRRRQSEDEAAVGAAARGRASTGPVTPSTHQLFWLGEHLSKDHVQRILNRSIQDDALHIVFVDALYLHKTVFEFDAGGDDEDNIRNAIIQLNAMAFGLFNGKEERRESKTVFGHEDEVTEFVRFGCSWLLGAGHAERDMVEDVGGRRRYHDYPFDPSRPRRALHFERLKLVWRLSNFMDMFPEILERLGPRRRMKLLSAMCVQVPKDLSNWRQFHYLEKTTPVKLARGHWDGEELRSDENPPEDIVAVHPHPPTGWFSPSYRTRVALFYTEVQDVFHRWHELYPSIRCTSDLNVVKYVQAISASCDNNEYAMLYETPFAQGLVANHWDMVWLFFCWNRMMDILFQTLLSYYLTPASHAAKVPEWLSGRKPVLFVIVYLGIRSAAITILEFLSLWRLYQKGARSCLKNFFAYMNSYRVMNLLIEIFSAGIMIHILWDLEGLVTEHPFRFTALVFSKWSQLMLMFMNTYAFRTTMLPAWMAVAGMESVAFLFALTMLSSGTAMAYYALPIENDTDVEGGWHPHEYLHPFFVMARLNMMGDIDQADISGATTDKGRDRAQYFMWALNGFIIFCGVLFPVMGLNLYVGVLSNAYQKEVGCSIHAEGFLHATTSSRLLLALRWYPLRGMMRPLRVFGSAWSAQAKEDPDAGDGTWIAIAEDRFKKSHSTELDAIETLAMMRTSLHDPRAAEVPPAPRTSLHDPRAAEVPPTPRSEGPRDGDMREIMKAIQELQADLNKVKQHHNIS